MKKIPGPRLAKYATPPIHNNTTLYNINITPYHTIFTPGQAAQAQPAKEAASGVSALAGKTSGLALIHQETKTSAHGPSDLFL